MVRKAAPVGASRPTADRRSLTDGVTGPIVGRCQYFANSMAAPAIPWGFGYTISSSGWA
jgi:hypothetical protein